MPPREYYLPSRRLVSQDDKAITQRPDVPRSKFTGAWTRLTTFDAGYLYPIMVDEVLPGDHLSYNVTAYVRLQTPLFPIFSNQRIDTHFFFVPCRLLWANWRRFMGEQTQPTDTIDYTIPHIELANTDYATGNIWDHMGIPLHNITSPLQINALPLRAYNLIFNEWYRDQNLAQSFTVNTTDGPDNKALYELIKRAKFHDYFTSALPWPQKFTAPTLPLAGEARVKGIGVVGLATDNGGAGWPVRHLFDGANTTFPSAYVIPSSAVGTVDLYLDSAGTAAGSLGDIFADLSTATNVSINVFRQAFLVQQLLERDARGGTRYIELIRAHFGVINPDFRLQRPEYIGGGSSALQVTPVAQTAPGASSVVGQLGGAATSVGQHRASYAATEHGYIIGILSVRTELSYSQGLNRMWSRQTRYDFYWPSLAGLGEQAIYLKEIYTQGGASDDTIFGYQERWHEYRQRQSEVTGYMRPGIAGTLDAWHLSERFSAAPSLNATFIRENPPMTRVLAAGALATNQQYLADILFQRTAVRPIPTFGTPVTLGRF